MQNLDMNNNSVCDLDLKVEDRSRVKINKSLDHQILACQKHMYKLNLSKSLANRSFLNLNALHVFKF